MRIGKVFLLLFVLVGLTDLLIVSGMLSEYERIYTKTLLMPLLAVYFLTSLGSTRMISYMVLLALFFSWLGDCFLLFESTENLFFIFGLGSFLMAHLVYIYVFRKTRGPVADEKANSMILPLIILAYAIGLVIVMWPTLGDLKVPVLIYAITIALMGISALLRNVLGKQSVLAGALLFILSDSLLAIDKFYQEIHFAGLMVMVTYLLAQFFIITGMIRYLADNEGAAS